MSKRDRLTDSTAFQTFVPTGQMSDRGRAIAGITGDPEPPAPAAPPTYPRVPVDSVAHNPYNPRLKLPAIQNMADSMEQIDNGLITPLAVVTRQAFLAAHPETEAKLGPEVQYIVIDGNRRLAGAQLFGLETVPIYVDDSLATDRDAVLKAALIADAQHEDLDPLDQALALEQLMALHGSQRQVAKQLGKSQGWVSQRLSLLSLTSELRDSLTAGELSIEIARLVAKLPPDQQADAVRSELARREDRPTAPQAATVVTPRREDQPLSAGNAAAPGTAGDYDVITQPPRSHKGREETPRGPRPTSAAQPAARTTGADDITHTSPPTLAVLVGWLQATSDEQLAEALLRARPSRDLYALMNTLTGRLEDSGLHNQAQ